MSESIAIPTELSDATSLALADLSRGSAVKARVTFDPAPEGPIAWRVTATFPDGTGIGFEVKLEDFCHLAVAVADGLQTAFIEQTGIAVPACPGHNHPMRARCLPGEGPAWTCPTAGGSLYAIGAYSADRNQPS